MLLVLLPSHSVGSYINTLPSDLLGLHLNTGKIKVSKLPFYEYLNAEIAILLTAIFKSVCIEVDGTNFLEQDKILDKKKPLKE